MKIQSINNFNSRYNSNFNTRPKTKINSSMYEGGGKKSIQSPETLRAYFLYKQNNKINFTSKDLFSEYIKYDFFRDFNPVNDYDFLEEFKDYAFKKGKIKREDFEKLSKEKQTDFKFIAFEFCDDNCYELDMMNPEIIAEYSNNLKNYFDKIYGANKYRIIAPGTSPSSVAQGMEYLGCEVIYLPFSNIRKKFDDDCHSIKDIPYSYKDFKNAKIAMNYLSSKGVGRDEDKKINIVLDYVSYGNSLYSVTKFINEFLKEQHPLKRPKVKAYSLVDTIEKLEKADDKKVKKYKILIENDISKLDKLCNKSRIEYVSPVPHFDILDETKDTLGYIESSNKTEEEVFKEFEDYSTPLSRIYSIRLLDEIQLLQNKNPTK